MKLTKQGIEQLANEIKAFLEKYEMNIDVSIYYNGKVERAKYDYDAECGWWVVENDVDPHNYFEYAAYNHILSMSFEGPLYDSLNNTSYKEEEFMAIFAKYGVYYELGYAWSLTCYPCSDNMEVEYTYYDVPQPTINLYDPMDAPTQSISLIMMTWHILSELVGDVGSCVLGAGFKFKLYGKKYFMSAQSPYQGSISWETHADKIKEMLKYAGATEISYEWGNMD